MTVFRALLEPLVRADVEFVVVVGVALVSRGGSRLTQDLDVVYARSRENIDRLVAAIAPLHPRLRGAPPELPFFIDARALRSGLNFTLATDAGDLDLLGEVVGLGGYPEASAAATRLQRFGLDVAVLDLDGLERTKRAAGRAKDLLDLEMIAALKRERAGSSCQRPARFADAPAASRARRTACRARAARAPGAPARARLARLALGWRARPAAPASRPTPHCAKRGLAARTRLRAGRPAATTAAARATSAWIPRTRTTQGAAALSNTESPSS